MPVRSLGDRMGSEDIVAERFAYLLLQQGHVLVRCSMENHLWPRLPEDMLTTDQITAITDPCIEQEIWKFATKFLFDPIKVEFR